MNNYLIHHGVKGMRWGIRKVNSSHTTFMSGSSKTQDKNSEYYRKKLPKKENYDQYY